MATKKGAKKGAGRAARTLRSLVYITALGVALAVYNAVSLRRDVALAIGPKSKDQEQFFRDSAERPDIATFFKNLSPTQRLRMSKNIGRYSDPELAKLCGKCLGSFDPAARVALTDSLAVVSRAHPDATAALLTLPGSFQQLAISTALRSAGPTALPLVAKEFSEGDARPNAVAYLVAAGQSAVSSTIPYLSNADKDIRLAAADTLGKIRATQAVGLLTKMLQTTDEEERLAYLTALAGIGDPSSETLMTQTLKDESLPTQHRAQAALGLGVIGTTSSLTTLWSFAPTLDKSLRESAISALQVAGDPALRLRSWGQGKLRSQDPLLQVAGGVRSTLADQIIRQAISSPETSRHAAEVSGNRPSLVDSLVRQAKLADAATQGDVIDSIFRALATTAEGRIKLKNMETSTATPALAALASRRLSFQR